MANVIPLTLGVRPRGLVIGSRPRTAPSAARSSTRTPAAEDRGPTPLRPGRAFSEWSAPEDQMTTEEVIYHRLRDRLATVRCAFRDLDPGGTGWVSCDELGRVLETRLSLSQRHLQIFLNKVCKRNRETVDYMQFLWRYSKAPKPQRGPGNMRHRPENSCMPLSEIQKHLKDKVGGNPKTLMRAFRLFDYNLEGRVQQHNFRRVLDNYCVPLTDKEFQRVWNYYSPNNMADISYKLFLDKLGFSNDKNTNLVPDCTNLEVASKVPTPLPERKVQPNKQRPASHGSKGHSSFIQGLSHSELQNLFHKKMCESCTSVWQTLRAFDATCSGLVPRHVLRSVLSSFLFPMDPHTFHKLTSSYGVKATGQVNWKLFLGYFMRQNKEEGNSTPPHTDRLSKRSGTEAEHRGLQRNYSRLTEIFHLSDRAGVGWITRADLRHALEVPQFHLTKPRAPGRTGPRSPRPRLSQEQIRELLNLLDPQHTGVVTLASLERLNPTARASPVGVTAPPPCPVEVTEEAQERNTDETSQWAERPPVMSSPSWTADKQCDQMSSALAALRVYDPKQTGYVTQEELKRVVLHYGIPISRQHFKELCEPHSGSGRGPRTSRVRYTEFLRSLGQPRPEETHQPSSCCNHDYSKDRQSAPPQSPPASDGAQSPSPRSPAGGPKVRSVMEVVFGRMRERLERRRVTLADRVRATTHGCEDGTLSKRDLRKVLEDSWVILEKKHFHELTQLLGFRGGRLALSEFLAKYEEILARDGERDRELYCGGGGDKARLLTAEECLVALKPKIKNIYGDNLTAFRLMDRNRDGLVDCWDFKELYTGLGLVAREKEYQRLLRLIGLHPGGNLNYPEFFGVVQTGKLEQQQQTASVTEQLHEALAFNASHKWPAMSKVLCRFDDDDGQVLIFKKGLRFLLYTYNLPLRSDEFEQLWSRYDPEGRGWLTGGQFLDRLGVVHDGRSGPRSQEEQQDPDIQQACCDATSLEDIE